MTRIITPDGYVVLRPAREIKKVKRPHTVFLSQALTTLEVAGIVVRWRGLLFVRRTLESYSGLPLERLLLAIKRHFGYVFVSKKDMKNVPGLPEAIGAFSAPKATPILLTGEFAL